MNLKTYLKAGRGRASLLAEAAGVTTVFVRNVANGHKRFSLETGLVIERASGGAVRAEELLPEKAELIAYVRNSGPDHSPSS